jgi:hypothetical protein
MIDEGWPAAHRVAALEETLDVLSSGSLMADIREALADRDGGPVALAEEETLHFAADR